MKNWKISILLLFIYISMHVSAIFVLDPVTDYFAANTSLSSDEVTFHGFAWTLFLTNLAAAIIFFFIIFPKRKQFLKVFTGKEATLGTTFLWGVVGFFLALFGQIIAGLLEQALFGVEPGSANTAILSDIAKVSPVIIISIVIFAPFLEEIIFRRVVFAGIYSKSNFWVAAFLSAIVFAVVHNELEHTLVYMAPAFAFAFVYYKSKRLLAPMIGHFLMNGFVVILQLNMEKIMELQKLQNAVFIFFLR